MCRGCEGFQLHLRLNFPIIFLLATFATVELLILSFLLSQVVERRRTPAEIREEFERLQREREERRLQQRTNPKVKSQRVPLGFEILQQALLGKPSLAGLNVTSVVSYTWLCQQALIFLPALKAPESLELCVNESFFSSVFWAPSGFLLQSSPVIKDVAVII